jgi:xanthine dehydrogenase accessory factor
VARGERGALVTIVRTNGSTPQRVGAKLLVLEDGRTLGTIGGGCYENEAVLRARAAIADGCATLARFDLNDDLAEESGLICGGQMEVFIEPIAPPPDVYVVGAGHVGYHVARLAALVGFRVHVLDDREKFADAGRFPDAVEVVVDAIPDWLAAAAIPRSAAVVIVTRGHRHDLAALRAVVGRHLHYVGLIGSRAKLARLFEVLRTEHGIADEVLARVHGPIGLDIGAVTPEEIAVSIVAELIAARYGRLRDGSGGGRGTAARSLRRTPPAPAPSPAGPAG